jgi:hypothetical protein
MEDRGQPPQQHLFTTFLYINTAAKIEIQYSTRGRWGIIAAAAGGGSRTPVPAVGGGGLHFGFRNLFIDKCNMKKTKKGT